MVFALFFLAISTVVFSTATNWKEQTENQKKKVSDLEKQVNTAKADSESRSGELAKLQADHKAEVQRWENEKTNIDQQNKTRQDEITDLRKQIELAIQNTKINGEEAQAKAKETEQLREQLKSVQGQANDYKLSITDLNDKIRVLTRELDVATQNNRQLRDRVSVLSTVIRTHNLSADTDRITRVDNPPDVEGKVSKVDARNNRVEITVGSNDGLVEGNTMYIYRVNPPDAGYIGKIELDMVDPNQGTGHVVGRTVQGKKIREGDNVTTKIRPRG
jgi:predicted nuclease with TOPRIM domain